MLFNNTINILKLLKSLISQFWRLVGCVIWAEQVLITNTILS